MKQLQEGKVAQVLNKVMFFADYTNTQNGKNTLPATVSGETTAINSTKPYAAMPLIPRCSILQQTGEERLTQLEQQVQKIRLEMNSVQASTTASPSDVNQFSPRPGWMPDSGHYARCEQDKTVNPCSTRTMVGVSQTYSDSSLSIRSTDFTEIQTLRYRNALLESELIRTRQRLGKIICRFNEKVEDNWSIDDMFSLLEEKMSVLQEQVATYEEDFKEEKSSADKLRQQKSTLQSHLNGCKETIESQTKKLAMYAQLVSKPSTSSSSQHTSHPARHHFESTLVNPCQCSLVGPTLPSMPAAPCCRDRYHSDLGPLHPPPYQPIESRQTFLCSRTHFHNEPSKKVGFEDEEVFVLSGSTSIPTSSTVKRPPHSFHMPHGNK